MSKITRPKLLWAGILNFVQVLMLITALVLAICIDVSPKVEQTFLDYMTQLQNSGYNQDVITILQEFFIKGSASDYVWHTVYVMFSIVLSVDIIIRSRQPEHKYIASGGLMIDLIGSFIMASLISVILIIIQMISDDSSRRNTASSNPRLETKILELKAKYKAKTITQEQYSAELNKLLEGEKNEK